MSENLNEPLPISQQDWAYEQLRTDILNSTIAPSSKLQISDLKDRYQTSVGPVREAVSRLAAEGLVVKRGQRGYWAAPASLEEFREITRLRIILEVDALCHSVNNGDLEWEAKVVGAMYRLSSFSTASGEQDDIGDGAYQDENRRFHINAYADLAVRSVGDVAVNLDDLVHITLIGLALECHVNQAGFPWLDHFIDDLGKCAGT